MVEFRLGELENGDEFPPGHLAEHQATAEPVVVYYRMEGNERFAVRLEDAGGVTGYSTAVTAASSSSSLKISMNDAVTIPLPSTTKTHGSLRRPPLVGRGGGGELGRIAGQDRLELPIDELELVRLHVDERHVRMGRGDGLEPVEGRAALLRLAELRRRERYDERLLGGERVGDGRLVEGVDGLVVGRDLRHVAADVGERRGVRRRRLVADRRRPPRPAARRTATRMTSGALSPTVRRELRAPRARRREVRVEDVDADGRLDRPDEGRGPRQDGCRRIRPEVEQRDLDGPVGISLPGRSGRRGTRTSTGSGHRRWSPGVDDLRDTPRVAAPRRPTLRACPAARAWSGTHPAAEPPATTPGTRSPGPGAHAATTRTSAATSARGDRGVMAASVAEAAGGRRRRHRQPTGDRPTSR